MRRRSILCCVAALALLALLAGCAAESVVSLSGRPARRHPAPAVAYGLLAAEDEFTSLFSEEGVVLDSGAAATLAPPVARPTARAQRLGIRMGYLTTVDADQGDWSPAVASGVYLRRAKPPAPRSVLEIGVDYSALEQEDGSVSCALYGLRGDMLFGNWNAEARGVSIYFLGGAGVLAEQGEHGVSGEAISNLVSGLEVGLGIGSTRGTWDLRAVYSFFPGSENVRGNVLVAGGVSF
jgi:hypothetical protein